MAIKSRKSVLSDVFGLRQNPDRLSCASRVEQWPHGLSCSLTPPQEAIDSIAKRVNEIPRFLAAEANACFSAALRHFTKITRSSGMLPTV